MSDACSHFNARKPHIHRTFSPFQSNFFDLCFCFLCSFTRYNVSKRSCGWENESEFAISCADFSKHSKYSFVVLFFHLLFRSLSGCFFLSFLNRSIVVVGFWRFYCHCVPYTHTQANYGKTDVEFMLYKRVQPVREMSNGDSLVIFQSRSMCQLCMYSMKCLCVCVNVNVYIIWTSFNGNRLAKEQKSHEE